METRKKTILYTLTLVSLLIASILVNFIVFYEANKLNYQHEQLMLIKNRNLDYLQRLHRTKDMLEIDKHIIELEEEIKEHCKNKLK